MDALLRAVTTVFLYHWAEPKRAVQSVVRLGHTANTIGNEQTWHSHFPPSNDKL